MSDKVKRKFLTELVLFTVLFAVIAAFIGYTGFVIGKSDFASVLPTSSSKS